MIDDIPECNMILDLHFQHASSLPGFLVGTDKRFNDFFVNCFVFNPRQIGWRYWEKL